MLELLLLEPLLLLLLLVLVLLLLELLLAEQLLGRRLWHEHWLLQGGGRQQWRQRCCYGSLGSLGSACSRV